MIVPAGSHIVGGMQLVFGKGAAEGSEVLEGGR